MTNKKLKPSNIQYGMMKRDVVNANGKVLLTAMCALHKMGVGAKTLVDIFDCYAHGTVKQWRQNFDDDVFDKRFAKELEEMGITFKGFDEYIFTEKEKPRRKIYHDELRHLARGREALRAIQEERNKTNDTERVS